VSLCNQDQPDPGPALHTGGEDFTIAGCSPNTAGLKKSVATEKEALRFRCPLVRLHEGGGGSVGGNKKADSRDTNARLVNTLICPAAASY
jgi:acetyl-CoA carboxylase carboxyltransferase component